MRRIDLTPFVEDVVAAILKDAVKHANMEYEGTWYRDHAAAIIQCSAGHPACIVALVQHFYDELFLVSDLNQDRVFAKCVVPIVEAQILTEKNLVGSSLRTNIDLLSRVLMELSLCRLITPPHIEVVTRRSGLRLGPEELVDLEMDIEESLLVQVHPVRKWRYIPDSIRRLLERWLRLQLGSTAAQHREFASCYETWLNNSEESAARNPISGSNQAIYICEMLFHHVLSCAYSGQLLIEFLKGRLAEHAEKLRPGFPGESRVSMIETLYDKMLEDCELRNLVETHASPGAYDSLLSVIKI
jgi:hypothetical protein